MFESFILFWNHGGEEVVAASVLSGTIFVGLIVIILAVVVD